MIRVYATLLAMFVPIAATAAETDVIVPAAPSFLGIPLEAIPAPDVASVVATPDAIPVRPRSRSTVDVATPAPVARAKTRSLAPRPTVEAAPSRRMFQMPWMTGVYQ